jgi:hypothetical protein
MSMGEIWNFLQAALALLIFSSIGAIALAVIICGCSQHDPLLGHYLFPG